MKTGLKIFLFVQKTLFALYLIIPCLWLWLSIVEHPAIAQIVIDKPDAAGLILAFVYSCWPFLVVYLLLSFSQHCINHYSIWVRNQEILSIPPNRHIRWWCRDYSNTKEVVLKYKNDLGKLSWGYYQSCDVPEFEYGHAIFLNREFNIDFKIKGKSPDGAYENETILPYLGQFDRKRIHIDNAISGMNCMFLLEPNDEIELRFYGCQ
jgi:hypothetical protein